MLRILFFIFCVFTVLNLAAQDSLLLPISIDSISAGPINDEEYEEEDHLSTNINFYYKPTIIDQFFDVPAYNQYLFWDTLDIHPYASKLQTMIVNTLLYFVLIRWLDESVHLDLRHTKIFQLNHLGQKKHFF